MGLTKDQMREYQKARRERLSGLKKEVNEVHENWKREKGISEIKLESPLVHKVYPDRVYVDLMSKIDDLERRVSALENPDNLTRKMALKGHPSELYGA